MSRFWSLFAIVGVGAAAAISLLVGNEVGRALFLVELLIALSLVYVHMSGGMNLARLFDLPVLVTARIAVGFGIVPLQALLMPEKLSGRLQGDYDLVLETLALVILGMASFWIACKVLDRGPRSKPGLVASARPPRRTLAVMVGVYGIGFGCKVYLLTNGLFAYTASLEAYRSNITGAQIYMFGASFATLGLLLISIEKFSRHPGRLIRWLFWGIVLSEAGWGLVSGMKEFLLIDFLAIGAIATLCSGKLAKKWVACAVLGLILLYPLFNAYRTIIRGTGSTQVNTFATAFSALSQALNRFGGSAAYDDWIETGTQLTLVRLDSLQSAALMLSLPNRAEELQGEERLWMLPVYPFVPRFLWQSKPILDRGSRMNRALGGTGDSSDATPYIIDCYTLGGVFGVIAGMFALGMITQRLANCVKGSFSKRDLLWYSAAFLFSFEIELGVFQWWAATMKLIVVIWAVGWLAYGSGTKRTLRTVVRAGAYASRRAADRVVAAPAVARGHGYGSAGWRPPFSP